MGIVLWTPAEHEIIRTCSMSEALVRLPDRTMMAIKTMRKNLGVGPPLSRWTKAEIRKLRKHCHEPIGRLVRRFKNRTAEAIRQQKSAMGLSSPNVAAVLWKTTDLAKLKKLYPLAPRSDLLSIFPNRSWLAIKAQAGIQGWRRVRRSTPAPNDLYDAVRTGAREDGIALGKLGRQTGYGAYFQNSRSKTVDLNKIGRAVVFLVGSWSSTGKTNSARRPRKGRLCEVRRNNLRRCYAKNHNRLLLLVDGRRRGLFVLGISCSRRKGCKRAGWRLTGAIRRLHALV